MTIKDLISGFTLKRDEQTLACFEAAPNVFDFGIDQSPMKFSILDKYTPGATSADLAKNKNTKNMTEPSNKNAANNPSNYFAKDLVINGSVESSSNIEAVGTINGNVTSQSDVRILGRVKGNIFGRNVIIDQAVVEGDIIAQDTIKVGAGTQITGNITCENFETLGSVNGNIDVKQLATFKAGSDTVGDITSCKVSINEDAMITGNLKITRKAAEKVTNTAKTEA